MSDGCLIFKYAILVDAYLIILNKSLGRATFAVSPI